MLLVDKRLMMRFFLIFIFIFLIFNGCVSKTKEISYSQKNYNNISKDQVLHSAKKVLLYADKDNFRIDSYNNEVNASRAIGSYRGVTMNLLVDNFYLKVKEEDNGSVTGYLSISKADGVDEEDRVFIDPNDDIYKLFWDRVDYFLNLKKDWSGCTLYNIKFNFDQLLCDMIDLKNKTPDQNDTIIESFESNISMEDQNDTNSTKVK
jgi:hypothetical protein